VVKEGLKRKPGPNMGELAEGFGTNPRSFVGAAEILVSESRVGLFMFVKPPHRYPSREVENAYECYAVLE